MTLTKKAIAMVLAATLSPLAVTPLRAQDPPPNAARAPQRAFSQAELDQMLAPIALYPDALLSQVLMASTYPLEVVEAARWTRANPGLQGDAAVRAVENQDWDPSVKSLAAFPQVLQRMDENLRWTESLGDAFLAQEAAVMDTVQQLRRRAQAAGNLRSTEQIQVVQEGQVIYVRPAYPEVVYVPYYDPLVIYGAWWWPAYRPVYWAPWPGYARAPGVSVGFWFGRPSGVSLNFFYGDVDWGRRYVRVARPDVYYYRPPRVVVQNTTVIQRNVTVERNVWQHDPHHRRGVEYRAPEVRQRFADAQVERRDTPREERARPEAQARPRVQPQVRQEPRSEPRAQPQVQKEQRAEPRPQPKERKEQRAEPRPQPQVRQEQRAEPRPQPQHAELPRPQPQRAEPHPQPQERKEQRAEPRQQRPEARQESKGGRGAERGERGERGNGKGGGDRS